MNRCARAGVVLLAVSSGLAGCGSGALTGASTGSSHSSPGAAHRQPPGPGASGQLTGTLKQSAPPSLTHDPLIQIPATQKVATEGARLAVTVRAVIDPLEGSGAVLQRGMRAVGVIVQIRNAGPAVYDSSATGDFTVVPSSGVVTPVLATRGICKTPLEDFDRYITAGEDRVGCVVLAVPVGAALTEVTFSPHAQGARRLVWAP